MPFALMYLASIGLAFYLSTRVGWMYVKAYGEHPWAFLRDLLECPFCLGMWSGAIIWVSAMFTDLPLTAQTVPQILVSGAIFSLATGVGNYIFEKVVNNWR